jgi:drug/metabolite transporter (DMT)-like permease
MTPRKYLVLLAIMVLGASGDCMLSRGVRGLEVSAHNWQHTVWSFLNPWVIGGVLLLIGFIANYLTALSWADLTFVLPATGMGYIATAVLAKFFLHEMISPRRWLGIVLITIGVGFVAGGPSKTVEEHRLSPPACDGVGRGDGVLGSPEVGT